jgi:hypothetical protein
MTNNAVPHQAASESHEQGDYVDRHYGETYKKIDTGTHTDRHYGKTNEKTDIRTYTNNHYGKIVKKTDVGNYTEKPYRKVHSKADAAAAEEAKGDDGRDKITGDRPELTADELV